MTVVGIYIVAPVVASAATIFLVCLLNELQNSMIFIPYCPKACPNIGDGAALFANNISLTVATPLGGIVLFGDLIFVVTLIENAYCPG